MNAERHSQPSGQDFGAIRRLFLRFCLPYRKQLVFGLATSVMIGLSVLGTIYGAYMAAQAMIDGTKGSGNGASVLQKIQERAEGYGVHFANVDGTITLTGLGIVFGFMLLTFLFKEIATYLNAYTLRWIGARAVQDIRNATFSHLQEQSLAFYSRQDVGALISRCTADVSTVENAVSQTVADICVAPITIVVSFGLIALLAYQNHLLQPMCWSLPLIPLCIVPLTQLGRRLKKNTSRNLEQISALISRMQENFTCIQLVKAYHTEKQEAQQFEADNQSYFRTVMKAFSMELLIRPSLEFTSIALCCFFLMLCFVHKVPLAVLGALVMAANAAYKPLKQVASINANLQKASAAAERIEALLAVDTAIPEKPNARPVDSFHDRIVFEDVSFRYDRDGVPVLKKLNLTIRKGDVVAFVGATGSGKTTAANLLARFYDPTEGRILLDGQDLRDLRIASLRRLVGVVTQNSYLFNTTIRANLAYGTPGATQAEIELAARQANAHDFIVNDPEGYDKLAGDKGFRLSGGQKQRISIARAILRNPPILILDEATSALDTVTEQQVQEAINQAMQNRTVLAIAHRLSTVRHATCIYVLDQGEVVESGTHDELYARGGRYRRLCDMQFQS